LPEYAKLNVVLALGIVVSMIRDGFHEVLVVVQSSNVVGRDVGIVDVRAQTRDVEVGALSGVELLKRVLLRSGSLRSEKKNI
jgi:hypothetical protein